MANTYVPILRNKQNERAVIQKFGGLNHFTTRHHDRVLKPLIEVQSRNDLKDLDPFLDAGAGVFVDLPIYLKEQRTKMGPEITKTINQHGGRENFYRKHEFRVQTPVISGTVAPPVEYGIHISHHMALEDTFPSLAHRLMVRTTSDAFGEDQLSKLERLASIARNDSDKIFFDVVDTVHDPQSEPFRRRIQTLTEIFSEFDKGLFNVINVFDKQINNFTPSVAEELDFEAIGDFGLNNRYPRGGGPTPTKILRHYHPQRGVVREFRGDDYSEASEELLEWDEWDPTHCEFCRTAQRAAEGQQHNTPSKWKRIRMGHYIESVLEGSSGAET